MVRPEELLGLTLLNRYRVKRYRGDGCEGWIFLAASTGQALLNDPFSGSMNVNVMLEVITNGRRYDPRQVDELAGLQPHPRLLGCQEVGRSEEGDLAGASYVVWEPWENTLAGILGRHNAMGDQEVRIMAREMAAALARYHSLNRVHGDVRAERICQIDRHWKLTPVLRSGPNGGKGDTTSAATPQDDVYALGLVLLHCLSPRCASRRQDGFLRQVSRSEIEQALCSLPPFWQHWLRRCLAADPSQRCSAAELALMDSEIPSPIAEVFVDREGDQYHLQWQPSDRSAAQVYHWLRGRCPAKGEIWLRADLERNAQIVPMTTPAAVCIQLPPGAACQIIVATLVGDAAVIGESFMLSWAADVQGLGASVEGETLVAMWDWPDEAPEAHVVVRMGEFPTGPDDPKQLARKRCFRAGYSGRFVMPIRRDEGIVYVTVYAKYPTEDGGTFACGRTRGARTTVAVACNIRLHYWVEKVSLLAQWLFGAKPCRLCLRANRTAALPELTLVAGENGFRSNAEGGSPVLHVPARQYEQGMVVQKDFQMPEGATIENTRLLVRGTTHSGVRLVPERGRISKVSA